MNNVPVGGLTRTLPILVSLCRYWHGNGVLMRGENFRLDNFPNEQIFAAAKRTHIVAAFNQAVVDQLVTDSARVVVNSSGKLFGGEVGMRQFFLQQFRMWLAG